MEKDKKDSPGAEGHKVTRFGSTGKATFQTTDRPRFDYNNLTPDTMTVADVRLIPDDLIDRVAEAMGMHSDQLFVKAVQNQERMKKEAGKLPPTYTVYTKDDIPRLITDTEPNVQKATNGNVTVPDCDGHTTIDNEQCANVHEEEAKQMGTTSDQPSIESTIKEREDEPSSIQGGVEQDASNSHIGGQGKAAKGTATVLQLFLPIVEYSNQKRLTV